MPHAVAASGEASDAAVDRTAAPVAGACGGDRGHPTRDPAEDHLDLRAHQAAAFEVDLGTA